MMPVCDCKRCTGKCYGMDGPVFVPPSLFKAGKAEGLDMRGYAPQQLIPDHLPATERITISRKRWTARLELEPGALDHVDDATMAEMVRGLQRRIDKLVEETLAQGPRPPWPEWNGNKPEDAP